MKFSLSRGNKAANEARQIRRSSSTVSSSSSSLSSSPDRRRSTPVAGNLAFIQKRHQRAAQASRERANDLSVRYEMSEDKPTELNKDADLSNGAAPKSSRRERRPVRMSQGLTAKQATSKYAAQKLAALERAAVDPLLTEREKSMAMQEARQFFEADKPAKHNRFSCLDPSQSISARSVPPRILHEFSGIEIVMGAA